METVYFKIVQDGKPAGFRAEIREDRTKRLLMRGEVRPTYLGAVCDAQLMVRELRAGVRQVTGFVMGSTDDDPAFRQSEALRFFGRA